MPEGDTIHRLATKLEGVLIGERIDFAWSRAAGELKVLLGEEIVGTEARGKNLLVAITGGWSFRVHLGMGGRSNVLARPSDPPPTGWASLIVDTQAFRWLVWKASRADLLRTAHVRVAPGMKHLGPDLLAPTCDLDEVMRRARARGNRARTVGELLLDQRVAAGIGNVIRCEAMFLAGLCPWTLVAEVTDGDLRIAFEHAVEILERGVSLGRRDTTAQDGERYFVYGRLHRPCLKCGAKIASERQGPLARVTYHCPTCQGDG